MTHHSLKTPFPPWNLGLSILLASLLASCASQPKLPAAPRLQCLASSGPAHRPNLPDRLQVGVETIHRDPQKVITIFVPLAPESEKGARVFDANERKTPPPPLPQRFAISDGTVRSAFIGVDQTPKSPLHSCVAEIAARAAASGSGPEATYTYLRDHVRDYLEKSDDPFEWDPGKAAMTDELNDLFKAAKDMPVGNFPLRNETLHPVVPLENFLRAGRGTCLQQALVTSLVLSELKLPHRFVNGATQGIGHTWIELADGRILDASKRALATPKPSPSLPGWFSYGDMYVFENQVWPFLKLP